MIKQLITRITQKKKQLDQLKPFPVDLIKNLNAWLRIELTYTSNAIEWNTLTRQETNLVVNEWLSVSGKLFIELLEAKNHDTVLSVILEFAQKLSIKKISQQHILYIHQQILKGINDINAGVYRSVPVRIIGSQTILPNYLKVPDLMDDLEQRLSTTKEDPLIIAIELHYRLVSIHPFIDGNGRTARLLFDLVLLIAWYPLAFVPVTERARYISSLEQAQTGWPKTTYQEFMLWCIESSLDLYLNTLQNKLQKPKKESIILLKISELARQSGENISTIRYWTKEGILEVAKTTTSNYALYDPKMIGRVKLIRQLQDNQRLSILEIKKILR